MELHFAPSPNPSILAWARSEGGFTVERAAGRASVRPKRVLEWEQGEREPTVRQVKLLASLYQRPLSLFFQDVPPKQPPLAGEYRRLPNVVPGAESAELRLAIRQMLARRDIASNLLGELEGETREFTLRARLDESPADAGAHLRGAAGVSIEEQMAWKDGWQAWREWRGALERTGALIFMFTGVPLKEVRGLALLRMPLPVAAVNTKEMVPEARVYTALHEVIHLMLAAAKQQWSALSEHRPQTEWQQVERFVESAANHALVPEAALNLYLDRASHGIPTDIDGVRRLARAFKFTPKAAATRLWSSGHWNWTQYEEWLRDWDSCVANLPERKSGPVEPAVKALGRGGHTFAQLVLQALDSNRITSVDAARYLGIRFSHIENLRERLVSGAREESGDE